MSRMRFFPFDFLSTSAKKVFRAYINKAEVRREVQYIHTCIHTYRVTGCIYQKAAQDVAQTIFLIKIVIYLLRWEKVATTFCNLLQTSQSKQSHNRRKFAQSDHRTYIHTSPGVQWSSEQPADQKIVGSSSDMVYVCRV
jgi:hypothetical protein